MRKPAGVRAKSEVLAAARRERPPKRPRPASPRLRIGERRERILAKASEFFADYGLTAQTRALAEACGISQRLLYRYFPSKAALIAEVYRHDIAGPFKAAWFARLADRTQPVAERLNEFYREYYKAVLTRRWLRLFLYASLAEIDMAPTYIAEVVTRMLDLIVVEAAHELGLQPPEDVALRQELGWTLHGAVSHLAIRRHIYRNTNPTPVDEVLALQVRVFLAGLRAALPSKASPRPEVVT